MEWVDGNLGSKITMKYPAIILKGDRAHGEVLSIAFAGKGQHQDAGGKITHMAPDTSSVITSKSISKDGGRSSYRGLLAVKPGATGSKSQVVCDALIIDARVADGHVPVHPHRRGRRRDRARGDGHARRTRSSSSTCSSRGLTEEQANAMIVSGFVEPITKELPLEYAIEMNKLIQLQMEGSVG